MKKCPYKFRDRYRDEEPLIDKDIEENPFAKITFGRLLFLIVVIGALVAALC